MSPAVEAKEGMIFMPESADSRNIPAMAMLPEDNYDIPTPAAHTPSPRFTLSYTDLSDQLDGNWRTLQDICPEWNHKLKELLADHFAGQWSVTLFNTQLLRVLHRSNALTNLDADSTKKLLSTLAATMLYGNDDVELVREAVDHWKPRPVN